MGIYKKGENWYIDYYVQGRRKREKVGPSKKLAESVLAKRKIQVVEGRFLDIKRNEKIKFEEMANLYLEMYSKVNKKSYRRDLMSINRLNEYFKGKYLYELTSLDIDNYKRKRLEENRQYATINRELACLRGILNKASEWGKLTTAPAKVRLFRENNQRVRYLERHEAERLIKAATEPLKSIIVIALNTGMRRGEILNLKWKDVDFHGKVITLWDTKNREKRYIPMNSTVWNVLFNIEKNPQSEYVFPGASPSGHLGESYISHLFEATVKKAGLTDFRFHDLRHTFASWLVMKGINLKTVQELMGHKSFSMTLRYSHLSPDHKKEAVEFLVENAPKGKMMDTIWTPDGKSKNRKTTEVVDNK